MHLSTFWFIYIFGQWKSCFRRESDLVWCWLVIVVVLIRSSYFYHVVPRKWLSSSQQFRQRIDWSYDSCRPEGRFGRIKVFRFLATPHRIRCSRTIVMLSNNEPTKIFAIQFALSSWLKRIFMIFFSLWRNRKNLAIIKERKGDANEVEMKIADRENATKAKSKTGLDVKDQMRKLAFHSKTIHSFENSSEISRAATKRLRCVFLL